MLSSAAGRKMHLRRTNAQVAPRSHESVCCIAALKAPARSSQHGELRAMTPFPYMMDDANTRPVHIHRIEMH